MINNKTAGMSAAERKAFYLSRLYMILPIISVSLLILLWTTVARNSEFPSPKDTFDRLILLFQKPIKGLNIFGHVWASLVRVFAALTFNWTFGIAFGILIGWNKKCKVLFTPLFNAFRAIPPLAWIPLITIWMGTGELSKILIVIFGSLASIVVNTQAGMSNVEQLYLDVGTIFNANARQKLFQIAIPSALDAIFAGVRTSTSAAWMVVLAAEMLGAKSGVGFLITRGMDSIDMPLVLMSMIAIGIVGALLSIITQFAERLMCPWTRKRSD
ncbi:MAG: taurine ABC transporter permease [Clostridia bacterium BRH_c25]|nr:MAG: taurine ABC transporter permease [Clostridia bacterium BRH_c25]